MKEFKIPNTDKRNAKSRKQHFYLKLNNWKNIFEKGITTGRRPIMNILQYHTWKNYSGLDSQHSKNNYE